MTKALDPEIKALRALNRAMEDLPVDARRRCLQWFVNYWTGRSDITIEEPHTKVRGL